jgi:hypothetical protein
MKGTFPRGIWYEEPKKRFRVRKYRNGVSYLKGYYRTFDEAEVALKELDEYLESIPKSRKQRRNASEPDPSLAGTTQSIRARQ